MFFAISVLFTKNLITVASFALNKLNKLYRKQYMQRWNKAYYSIILAILQSAYPNNKKNY